MKKKKNWGGKRPGAGLPKIDGRRVSVILTESQTQTALFLGDGKLAAGIRIALDRANKSTKNCQ